MISGIATRLIGFFLLTIDLFTVQSNVMRDISSYLFQNVPQVLSFPLPIYGFENNSLTAIGIGTGIAGFDLLMISFGLIIKSKIACRLGIITFSLAAFFDFTMFMLKGVLGSPLSLIGVLLNAAMAYALITNNKECATK
jgi:hypothetical protein